VAIARILANWPLLESDFQSEYGLDLGNPEIRSARSWRWFWVRLSGLLASDTRLYRALAPAPEPVSDSHSDLDKEVEL
jgi:hypothetical protein